MTTTETTNEGHTMTTNAPATTQPGGQLAMRADGWTPDQTAVLRAMGLEHANDSDLKLFHHYASRTGLDPFTRQVYMVSRKTKVKVRELNQETGNERTVERDVDKFTIQVGIDGWRVLGNRAALREGVRVGHDDVLYRGKGADGWVDYWDKDEAGGPPVACKYVLTVDGTRISATCSYAEYVQMTRDGGEWKPNSMWQKMPANQLAKCAEALAWRKAFPADFSGLVLEDAAQAEVIDGTVVEPGAPPAPAKAEPKRARGADRVRERAHASRAAKQEPAPAAPTDDRGRTLAAIFERLAEGKVTTGDDQRIVLAELGGLAKLPDHPDELADRTLVEVLVKLDRMAEAAKIVDGKAPEAGSLEHQLDEVFRVWETRQPDEPADEAQS